MTRGIRRTPTPDDGPPGGDPAGGDPAGGDPAGTDPAEALRAALARTAHGYAPPAAPVGRILDAGRKRRLRRRASVVVAVAAVAVAGAAVPLGRWVMAPPPAAPASAVPAPAATVTRGTTVRPPLTAVTGHGTVDGTPWSVTLEFYPDAPAGALGPDPVAGAPLLCRRMVIGGIRIDHQGGPWTDCAPVLGTGDPAQVGETGLWGLHGKGTTGSRLMVGNTDATVAYAVVALTDGTQLTGRVVTLPHTAYRSWAVAVPDGRTIAWVDSYDADHRRLSHETQWR
jgi:alpha-D-ribose 1-methylphosphonate 5-triphosphate synthase subunit PhnG